MDFNEWFDINDPDHCGAYLHLVGSGVWPEGFIPEGTTFKPLWQLAVASDMGIAWAKSVMDKVPSNPCKDIPVPPTEPYWIYPDGTTVLIRDMGTVWIRECLDQLDGEGYVNPKLYNAFMLDLVRNGREVPDDFHGKPSRTVEWLEDELVRRGELL